MQTQPYSPESAASDIRTQGYAIVPDVLPPDFVVRAKKELEAAIEKEVALHGSKKYKDYGMVLLCSLYGGSLVELFDIKKAMEPFNAVMGEGCIVYAYTSSSMPPSESNYSNRIHVDCPRIIPNYITNMGATSLLDEFTEENGATWLLTYSQNRPDAPSD